MDDLTQIRRELEGRGHRLVSASGGHWHILTPEGKPLRNLNSGKPYLLPCSRDDRRAGMDIRKQLRDCGVDLDAPRPKASRKAVHKTEAGRAAAKRQSHVLRERLKGVLVEYDLRQADVVAYAEHYCGQHGIPGPKSPTSLVSTFLGGSSVLRDANYRWLDAAVSAIRAAKGDIPRAGDLRDEDQGEPLPPEAHLPPMGPVVVSAPPTNGHKPGVSLLALEAMQLIYKPDPDDAAVASLCERIAALELGA